MTASVNYTCTGCGKAYQRKRPDLPVFVCPACFVIHPENTAAPIVMPEDMSLLTLDSVLEMEGSRYVFLGRYHYQQTNSYKNNWVLLNEKGELAYLLEATGYYAFCKPYPKGLPSDELQNLHPGNDITLEEIRYVVDAVDKNVLTTFEGELPETGQHGDSFFSAEMSTNEGEYAFVQLFDKKHSTVYTGKWGTFSEFKFSNTKQTTGDKDDLSALVKCPACNAEIRLVTHRQAVACACAQCRSYLRYDESGKLSRQAVFEVPSTQPTIPLHSVGTIHGNTYEVVGFLIKKEKHGDYDWREYILFNPVLGYASLSEYNGHWNFIYQLNAYPRDVSNRSRSVFYENNDFDLYNKYRATLLYAVGEFYVDVQREGDTLVREFINPPFMLVNEEAGDEVRWFLGEYITPSDIKGIFKLDEMPSRSGVGATQLMISGFKFRTLLTITAVFACLLFVTQLVFSFSSAEKKILSNTYYQHDMNAEKVIVTPAFELTGGTASVQFNVSCPLNNNWMDIDIELINDLTGERYEALKSLEFYSGYDEGAWSEGSQSEYVIISAVPEGKYHLNMYPDWGNQSNSSWTDPNFTLSVIHDVSMPSNFMWMLLLISIFPAIQYYRERNFESRRWMESDYSGDNE